MGSLLHAMLALLLLSSAMDADAARVKEKKKMPSVNEAQLFAEPQRIPELLAANKLHPEQVPSPHWRPDGCVACHRGKPTAKAAALRDRDVAKVCNNCHEAISPHSYIHPVGDVAPKDMLARMPASFRNAMKRSGDKTSCVTCHDLPMQCLPERARERGLNPLFFREGPYRARTDLCYRCHDAEQYERLNPHDQVAKDGSIKSQSCLVCHDDVEHLKQAKRIEDVGFNRSSDLSALCTGCHPWKPHPGGGFSFTHSGKSPEHLVLPSEKVRQRLVRMQDKLDVVLPLEPGTGKVFCGTCHNPHAKGVVQVAGLARGAESKKRLRLVDTEICSACHEK